MCFYLYIQLDQSLYLVMAWCLCGVMNQMIKTSHYDVDWSVRLKGEPTTLLHQRLYYVREDIGHRVWQGIVRSPPLCGLVMRCTGGEIRWLLFRSSTISYCYLRSLSVLPHGWCTWLDVTCFVCRIPWQLDVWCLIHITTQPWTDPYCVPKGRGFSFGMCAPICASTHSV